MKREESNTFVDARENSCCLRVEEALQHQRNSGECLTVFSQFICIYNFVHVKNVFIRIVKNHPDRSALQNFALL